MIGRGTMTEEARRIEIPMLEVEHVVPSLTPTSFLHRVRNAVARRSVPMPRDSVAKTSCLYSPVDRKAGAVTKSIVSDATL